MTACLASTGLVAGTHQHNCSLMAHNRRACSRGRPNCALFPRLSPGTCPAGRKSPAQLGALPLPPTNFPDRCKPTPCPLTFILGPTPAPPTPACWLRCCPAPAAAPALLPVGSTQTSQHAPTCGGPWTGREDSKGWAATRETAWAMTTPAPLACWPVHTRANASGNWQNLWGRPLTGIHFQQGPITMQPPASQTLKKSPEPTHRSSRVSPTHGPYLVARSNARSLRSSSLMSTAG